MSKDWNIWKKVTLGFNILKNSSMKMIKWKDVSPCSAEEEEESSFFLYTDNLHSMDFFYFIPFLKLGMGDRNPALTPFEEQGTASCLILLSLFSRSNTRKCYHTLSASSQRASLFCISGFTLSSSLRLESSLNVFLSIWFRERIWPKTNTNTEADYHKQCNCN